MPLYCCIEPQRVEKTERIMSALAAGTGGRICLGAPPRGEAFVVWGHRFLSETIIPRAIADGTPWWFIDNGFYQPARGGTAGYYSLTYRSLAPIMFDAPDMGRLAITMAPWRRERHGYVLLALPGRYYGQMLGFDMKAWSEMMRAKIRKYTRRQVVIRDKKKCRRPLADDLAGASVVVTHSSKIAVDAVIAGVPAIVAPTNPAAPVASTNLADIEKPKMPERERWWASLMAQQFTLEEMRSGLAAAAMSAIVEQWHLHA